jgi:uncharacterized protein (TIGR00725 family)
VRCGRGRPGSTAGTRVAAEVSWAPGSPVGRSFAPGNPVGRVSLYVGLAGASRPEAKLLDEAETLGRRLAEAGAVVVCGGGPGVMEAACRGARAAGGTTVGLLPGLDRDEGNPHLSVSLPTGLGQGRNLLLVRSADALVAVGGGFGTLSEIALALRTGVPVVGLATWSLSLAGRPADPFPVAPDATAAAHLALEAARARRADPNRPPAVG